MDVRRHGRSVLLYQEWCTELLPVDACSWPARRPVWGRRHCWSMSMCPQALVTCQSRFVLLCTDVCAQVPFDSFMQLEGERLTGQALVGTQLWQYRFDIPAGAREGAGTWQPALVVGFDAATGEHEVRLLRRGAVDATRAQPGQCCCEKHASTFVPPACHTSSVCANSSARGPMFPCRSAKHVLTQCLLCLSAAVGVCCSLSVCRVPQQALPGRLCCALWQHTTHTWPAPKRDAPCRCG